MDLWLLTKSANYYPESGTGDWMLLTHDHDEALKQYAATSSVDYHVCLIRIELDLGYDSDVTGGPTWCVENSK